MEEGAVGVFCGWKGSGWMERMFFVSMRSLVLSWAYPIG
jgi:hypothetical protein